MRSEAGFGTAAVRHVSVGREPGAHLCLHRPDLAFCRWLV